MLSDEKIKNRYAYQSANASVTGRQTSCSSCRWVVRSLANLRRRTRYHNSCNSNNTVLTKLAQILVYDSQPKRIKRRSTTLLSPYIDSIIFETLSIND